jgi:hypothetical protein
VDQAHKVRKVLKALLVMVTVEMEPKVQQDPKA